MSMPQEETWRGWGFLERWDWAAREVSKNGLRPPNWFVASHYIKSACQQLLFLFILYTVPLAEDEDPRENIWKNLVRFTIFSHAFESAGFRTGPMHGGRLAPWPLGTCVNIRYRLSRGTLKYTGFPMLQHFLGDRRTILDLMLQLSFFTSSAVAVLAPDRFSWSTAAAFGAGACLWVTDQQQGLSTHGPTYLPVMLAGCFSAARGGLAMGQTTMIMIWIASGLCKVGPWFAFVNGHFLMCSVWFRGRRWAWRWLWQGEDDLRPTAIASFMSHTAAQLEWLCPLLLFWNSSQVLIIGAAAVLVAMHVYIILCANLDVYNWNTWFAVSTVTLFGGGASFGFDYSGLRLAPWSVLLLWAAYAAYIIFGMFRPDLVPYNAGHRNWAGNWPQVVLLLRRDAAEKILNNLTTFGRPPWDPIPEELQSWYPKKGPHAGEVVTHKVLGNYWLHVLNLKLSPALIRRALGGRELQDFHIVYGNQLQDFCFGGFSCCMSKFPELLKVIQRNVHFEEGQCIAVYSGSFASAGRSRGISTWKVFDARVGVITEGKLTAGRAWDLASLPSACKYGEALLADVDHVAKSQPGGGLRKQTP